MMAAMTDLFNALDFDRCIAGHDTAIHPNPAWAPRSFAGGWPCLTV
jgi:hypothetical protein